MSCKTSNNFHVILYFYYFFRLSNLLTGNVINMHVYCAQYSHKDSWLEYLKLMVWVVHDFFLLNFNNILKG